MAANTENSEAMSDMGFFFKVEKKKKKKKKKKRLFFYFILINARQTQLTLNLNSMTVV
jgi:hypothetical protein